MMSNRSIESRWSAGCENIRGLLIVLGANLRFSNILNSLISSFCHWHKLWKCLFDIEVLFIKIDLWLMFLDFDLLWALYLHN